MSSSSAQGKKGSKDRGSFRVALQSISIERVDAAPEDDFKTWAHTTVVTRRKPNSKFWYTTDSEVNLGKTSVRIAYRTIIRIAYTLYKERMVRTEENNSFVWTETVTPNEYIFFFLSLHVVFFHLGSGFIFLPSL